MKLNLNLLFSISLLAGVVLPSVAYAADMPLTQSAYDQKIQYYTDIINQSKRVLDDPSSTADSESKSKSFCARIDAYMQIEKLSKDNIQLDMAPLMHLAAQNFLERQQKSLNISGMNTEFMCSAKQENP